MTISQAERPRVGASADDAALVEAVRAGDDRAFEVLYGRYHRRIAAYVAGMVSDAGRAEDVTQEVFAAAVRRMRATDAPIAVKPWLYEIARNACIDHFRRRSRAEEVPLEDDAEPVGPRVIEAPTDEAVGRKEDLQHLRGAFGALSEAHHRILVLRELEGLSYREIGEAMGLSRQGVESTLFRARRRLTEEYDEVRSGRRCATVQALVTTGGPGLGARERRRVGRHAAVCPACRRHAVAAGIAVERRTLARRVAGLLPTPWLLRRGDDDAAVLREGGAPLASWLPALGPAADGAAGSLKAVAAAAALAMASVGAGAAAPEAGGTATAADASVVAAERHAAPRGPAGALRPSLATRRSDAVASALTPAAPRRAARSSATPPPGGSAAATGAEGPGDAGVPGAAPDRPAPVPARLGAPAAPAVPGVPEGPRAPDAPAPEVAPPDRGPDVPVRRPPPPRVELPVPAPDAVHDAVPPAPDPLGALRPPAP